jgi:hypothetical protein
MGGCLIPGIADELLGVLAPEVVTKGEAVYRPVSVAVGWAGVLVEYSKRELAIDPAARLRQKAAPA